ncbi:hypothetical protein [Ferrovibrio sp.]|uniref:hypothetical protein n=1 Tax=Ferrovibrio sp. TaxID=1917215 RepID=UPI000CC54602|nr:hypothetical protein [Ferrovibrio sp.]PJI43541.1 MAG: hypothetical protein CTR53_04580 [Ferrovibrio sp.]
MTRLYYPLSRLWPDYLRAGGGLAICMGLVLFAAPQSVIFTVLVGLSLLFAWLGAVTAWRQQIEIELDTTGVVRRGWGRTVALPWPTLKAVTLRYYSTRRDRSEGWLQLVIEAEGGTLRVDSNLIGFPSLVERAFAAAGQNGVAISETSRLNAGRLHSVEGNQP